MVAPTSPCLGATLRVMAALPGVLSLPAGPGHTAPGPWGVLECPWCSRWLARASRQCLSPSAVRAGEVPRPARIVRLLSSFLFISLPPLFQ